MCIENLIFLVAILGVKIIKLLAPVLDFFYHLFDPVGFPARWYCGTWSEALGWLHIISDIATGLAYFAIPGVIIYFLSRKKDVPYNYIFWLFAGFIFFCGVEHFIEASIFWHPWYRLAGLAKACTAIVSLATLIALIRILPQAIEIPEKLRSQKNLFSIIQSLPIGLLQITPEGKIINANIKTLELLGIQTLDQIKNKSVLKLFSSTYHNELQSIFAQCLKGKSNKSFKIDRLIGFGSKHETILNIYVEKIKGDNSSSLLIGLKDLTDIEESHKALAKTSEYLQALLDNMADGVISLDANGIIKSSNPAACKIFGINEDIILGTSVADLIPSLNIGIPSYRENKDRSITPVRKGGVKYELLGQKPNGQRFPLNLTLSEMDIHGEKIFCGIVQDISSQKKYEATLKQKNEELMRINEDMEQFVYMVSHDLQEPLRAINNYLQIFNIHYLTISNGQETPYFEKISKCIERMKNLIQGVLQYSQIGMHNKNFAYINMDQMLYDLRDSFMALDYNKKVVIEMHNMLPVKGYKPLLEVLFQNLLSNGIKYNKNKEVMLYVKSDTWTENENMILYSVKDNGIGIAANSQRKIFKMFQRLHSPEEFKGLGIGLASCKKIVELHHGKIWVESVEGEGSTFYFTLPKFIEDEIELKVSESKSLS